MPLMILNYAYFDELVARQSSIIWYRINNAYPEARSPLQKIELGTRLVQFYYGAKDDFGTRIVDGFQTAYDLGMPFGEVLNQLVEEFQKQAAEKARPKIYTRKIIPKTIAGISIPLTVGHVEEYEKGKLVSKRYRDDDGTIRIESVVTQRIVSAYQDKALNTPHPHNVFKFLVSKFCLKVLLSRLEEETGFYNTAEKIESTISMEESSEKTRVLQSMTWNGTQKELGELFVELKRKGWIDEFNFNAIKSAFSGAKSIDVTMRPGKNTQGDPSYSNIYTSEYRAKFALIKKQGTARRVEKE